jgi:hypothetical protein
LKIYIATPMYGGIAKNNYVISLQNLVVKLSQLGHSVTTTTVGNESLITRARNTLAHKFMKSDSDALLFIDADHGWNADDVVRMIDSGKDVIGAIYPMKGINWENVRYAAIAGKQDLAAYSGHFAANLLEAEQSFDVESPFKVKDIGTGMLFIQRSVFEKLKPHCGTYKHNSVGELGISFGEEISEYFFTKIEDDVLLSEDYAFCHMWRDHGGDVWAAPWVTITHSGDYVFSGQFKHIFEINAIKQAVIAQLAKRREEQDAAEQAAALVEAESPQPDVEEV